jgi:hypothetical protein
VTDIATMAGLDPATLADVLRLAGSTGFDRIQDQIRRTGGCSDPIHLQGSTVTRDAASGHVLHCYSTDTEPGGRLRIACGNRRSSRCPSCAGPTPATPTTSSAPDSSATPPKAPHTRSATTPASSCVARP